MNETKTKSPIRLFDRLSVKPENKDFPLLISLGILAIIVMIYAGYIVVTTAEQVAINSQMYNLNGIGLTTPENGSGLDYVFYIVGGIAGFITFVFILMYLNKLII